MHNTVRVNGKVKPWKKKFSYDLRRIFLLKKRLSWFRDKINWCMYRISLDEFFSNLLLHFTSIKKFVKIAMKDFNTSLLVQLHVLIFLLRIFVVMVNEVAIHRINMQSKKNTVPTWCYEICMMRDKRACTIVNVY